MQKFTRYNRYLILLLPISIAIITETAEGATLQEIKDSTPTYELKEIEVEAPKVIRKADMEVYRPSQDAIKKSVNGLQLLSNLMIPSVIVDNIMGSVRASGVEVQLRINGRIATVEQVKNLTPETIKKVEWMDNPGLRFNDAEYVLNIVVSNPTVGGSFGVSLIPMLNVLFGNYNADLKLNNGRSQWNVYTSFRPADSDKVHRDYEENFRFPDGNVLNRTESPLGGSVHNTGGSAGISYSFIKPDTTIFYAGIGTWINFDNKMKSVGRLSLSDNSKDIDLYNEWKDNGLNPSLTLYLEQHFKGNNTLVFDFSSSLYKGQTSTNYMEIYPEENFILTDINTHIKDFNQAYGVKADYIKGWNKSKLTIGFNYNANRNRSVYRNLNNAVFHQRQDKIYMFSEFFQRLGKFTFTAGIGAQYNSFLFIESDQGSGSWNLRPQATITYTPIPNHQLRLNFTSWQNSPSLAETNIAPQQIDGFQWDMGNPNLKTYNNYRLNLRYTFNCWRITGNFNISALTSPHAIVPYLFWENDKLITSYENSKGKQSLLFSLSPQIEIVPNWFFVSGTLRYRAERSQGSGYKLYNHNWSGSIQGILSHWNFSLQIQYEKAARILTGEKISWAEDISSIQLVYNWNKWQFGAVMFMPFGEYDQGSKMLSEWNNNENHLRLDFRMVGIMIGYNLQWGKQKRSVNKLIDSDVSADKSSAKTR